MCYVALWAMHDDTMATFDYNIMLTHVHDDSRYVTLRADIFVHMIWKDHNINQMKMD